MPNVLDSFFIEIGLDPKNFTEGQKKVVDAFKKTQEEAKRRGKEIEEEGRRINNLMGRLRVEAIGLFAALAGASGVKSFIANMISGDAAVGRFARTTGIAVAEAAKFDKAVELAGGAFGAGQQALGALNNQIQEFNAGRGGEIISIYGHMFAEGGTIIDINAKILDQLAAIAKNARAIEARTPGRGGFYLRQLGINEDAINLLIRGNEYMQGVLDKAEKLGAAIKKDTDAAEEFLGKWRTLGQLLTGIFRPLESILAEGVLDPLNATLEKIAKNQKVMEDTKPADRPRLGRERMNNAFGSSIPEAFNRALDWFGPNDALINAIFGRPEDRLLSKLGGGGGGGGEKTKAIPYYGGAFGGMNFKPMGWDSPSSSSKTEINVNGPITIQTQATDAQGIATDLRSALEAVAEKRRLAIQANSGQE